MSSNFTKFFFRTGCLDLKLRGRPVASSIIGGGAHIYIFVFADHKNNRFQKKLIVQNTNI